MSTKGIIGVGGLKTSGNQLSFPPGSLIRADDIMFGSQGEAQPRRGIQYHASIYVDNDPSNANANIAQELWQWNDNLLIHYRGNAGARLALWSAVSTSPVYTDLGAFTEPDATLMRMKFAELDQSIYWTTNAGLSTTDSPTGTARTAGVAKPRDFMYGGGGSGTHLLGNPNDTGSWLPTNSAVGYRAVCGKKDTNGVVKTSAPNSRAVVLNPADVTCPAGSLTRSVVNTVVADVGPHNFQPGDVFLLEPGESGKFDAGNYTLTAVTPTTLVWVDAAHGPQTSTVDQTISSGFKSVQVQVGFTPSELLVGDFIQIYRTDETDLVTEDPGDECFQCYERALTATDISNGYVLIQDTTPPEFIGAALDTNANTGEGIDAGADERPPYCQDICVWNGTLFGAQTVDRNRLELRLLGVGAPNGLQTNDLVAINESVYTAGTNFFALTNYLPSINIDKTLQSLCAAIQGATAGIVVVRLSNGDSPPGEFLVEEVGLMGANLIGSAIYAASTRAGAWSNPMPGIATASSVARASNVVSVTTGAAHGFASGQNVFFANGSNDTPDPNFTRGIKAVTVVDTTHFTYAETGSNATLSGSVNPYFYATTLKSDTGNQLVRFSKPGEPESWPLPFFLGGLPDGGTLLRIRPTASGSGLMMFMKSGDIYRASGAYPYVVRRFDGTATLLAADSLVEHSSSLYGLTTQGIVSISDSGVGIVGFDVEDDLRALVGRMRGQPSVARAIFGVSYESDRQYQLWVPPTANAAASSAYVYHSIVQQFSKFLRGATCGLVFKGLDFAMLGDSLSNHLLVERKNFASGSTLSYLSFFDIDGGVQVDGNQSGIQQIKVLDASDASAGDLISISGTLYYVASVDDSTHLTILGGPVTVSNADVLPVFEQFSPTLTFAPDAAGAPGIDSHFREVQLHFGEFLAKNLVITFSNEKGDSKSVTVTNPDYVIGQPLLGVSLERIEVPRDVQRGTTLTVQIALSEACSYYRLLGISKTLETVSERTGRG